MEPKLIRQSIMHLIKGRYALFLLWSLVLGTIMLYVGLMRYWPTYVAHQYFNFIDTRVNYSERGGMCFFVEHQRRAMYELSQSAYLHNLITYMHDMADITELQVTKMESFIKAYQVYFGFKQIFLLDKNGIFAFSTVPGMRGKNINDPEYVKSPIFDSFKITAITLVPDITNYSFDPIVKQKALFIMVPVFFEKKLNGFLVAQLDNEQIEALLVKGIDLGKTGEYLILQRIDDLITFIVPPANSPSLTLPINHDADRTHGTLTQRCALGYEGYGTLVDYRGIKTVGTWYFMPQYNWGFVCKTDYTEVILPIHRIGFLALLLALLATGFTISYLRRRKTSGPNVQKLVPDNEIS